MPPTPPGFQHAASASYLAMQGPDPFHLKRFLDAQEGVYPQARAELAAGEKRSHWMWFIFPQLAGLGSSPMAQRYAIGDLTEAQAYLAHAVLGVRLRECAALVNAAQGKTVSAIFDYPDDLKFHSSMTLFAEAAKAAGDGGSVFEEALRKHFGGQQDGATVRMLR